jgi:hypothetical protein
MNNTLSLKQNEREFRWCLNGGSPPSLEEAEQAVSSFEKPPLFLLALPPAFAFPPNHPPFTVIYSVL